MWSGKRQEIDWVTTYAAREKNKKECQFDKVKASIEIFQLCERRLRHIPRLDTFHIDNQGSIQHRNEKKTRERSEERRKKKVNDAKIVNHLTGLRAFFCSLFYSLACIHIYLYVVIEVRLASETKRERDEDSCELRRLFFFLYFNLIQLTNARHFRKANVCRRVRIKNIIASLNEHDEEERPMPNRLPWK